MMGGGGNMGGLGMPQTGHYGTMNTEVDSTGTSDQSTEKFKGSGKLVNIPMMKQAKPG